jgi:hypothetical protein
VRYNSQVMLVVAESAVMKAFARFIDIKRASHQLERIVIDECHTILESADEGDRRYESFRRGKKWFAQ